MRKNLKNIHQLKSGINKEKLIEELIRRFSLLTMFSCPDYPDMQIYSYQYYKEILYPIIKDQKQFSIIYGDVNKLSIINDTYGKEEGDRILATLLRILKFSLPSNARFVRIGGDEFLVLLPNTDKNTANKYISKSNFNIERQKEYIHNAGITLVAKDSCDGPLEQLIQLADEEIAKIKNNNAEKKQEQEKKASKEKLEFQQSNPITLGIPKNISYSQQEKWKTLNNMIYNAMNKHILDLRPSKNFRYNFKRDLKKECFSIMKAIEILLNNHLDIETKSNDSNDINLGNLNINLEDAKLIDTFLTGKHSTSKLDDLDKDNLSHICDITSLLLEDLSRNQHSGLFSKSYYRLYLSDKLLKSNASYQVVYFSMFGIRPSNTAYGHFATDQRMQKTVPLLTSSLTQKLNERNKTFQNEAFSEFHPEDIFFIDQGGGNYITFIPSKYSLSQVEIKEIVDSVNMHYQDNHTSTLQIETINEEHINKWTIPFRIEQPKNMVGFCSVIYRYFIKKPNNNRNTSEYDTVRQKPFVKYARYIKELCNDKKDILKINSLDSTTNREAFEKVMEYCIEFYCDEIENFDKPEIKNFFLNNIFCGLVNSEDFFNYRKDVEKSKEENTSKKTLHTSKVKDYSDDIWIKE